MGLRLFSRVFDLFLERELRERRQALRETAYVRTQLRSKRQGACSSIRRYLVRLMFGAVVP